MFDVYPQVRVHNVLRQQKTKSPDETASEEDRAVRARLEAAIDQLKARLADTRSVCSKVLADTRSLCSKVLADTRSLYCESILFHGAEISSFEDAGHIRGYLTSWIALPTKLKKNTKLLPSIFDRCETKA